MHSRLEICIVLIAGCALLASPPSLPRRAIKSTTPSCLSRPEKRAVCSLRSPWVVPQPVAHWRDDPVTPNTPSVAGA
jgi:hypothetical protein